MVVTEREREQERERERALRCFLYECISRTEDHQIIGLFLYSSEGGGRARRKRKSKEEEEEQVERGG